MPNAKAPILVTDVGIVREVRPVPQKDHSSIVVTEFGMVTDVTRVSKNAYSPIFVTGLSPKVAGITKVDGQVPTQPVTMTLSKASVVYVNLSGSGVTGALDSEAIDSPRRLMATTVNL